MIVPSGTSQQTRNLVIYNPKIAKIVAKEARGGLIKGGGGIMKALQGYAEGGAVAPDVGGYEPTTANPGVEALSKVLGWLRQKGASPG